MNLENSLFKVTPHKFDKVINIPTSKSYANRALILGAIRGNGFTIRNLPTSTDVENLLNVFSKIGILFSKTNSQIIFHNSFPDSESKINEEVIDLHTGDGGTTNRFLIALLSRGKKTYRLFPTEKMRERPIADLILPLKKLDVKIEMPASGPWLVLTGPAMTETPRKLEIDCAKSTQFATALLLSFSNTPISFSYKNLNASEAYLKMTENLLKEKTFLVPADFSSLSYPAALALISGDVTIKNCFNIDPFQADSIFIELIRKNGGDLVFTKEGLHITSNNKLRPFHIDGAICPDLIPTLVFLASRIEGESCFENLAILRHKESDRIDELLKLLKIFQVDHNYFADTSKIIIRGSKKLSPAITFIPVRDHRIVMTTYLFMRANSGGFLGNTDCVKKSYPNFFEELD